MNRKKIIAGMVLMVFIALSIMERSFSEDSFINDNSDRKSELKKVNPILIKTSDQWDLTGTPILIDDTNPANDWDTINSTYDWCNGIGTLQEPYIIENVTIDGGGAGICIEIKNSNSSYFIIKNCTILNSSIGIKCYNVSRGQLINNTCYNNSQYGIHLDESYNNTLIGNNASSNINTAVTTVAGIYLKNCNNINVSKNNASNNIAGMESIGICLEGCNNISLFNNTANNNFGNNFGSGIKLITSEDIEVFNNTIYRNNVFGIYLSSSTDCNITENIMDYNGVYIDGKYSNIIDTTNSVHKRPVYYYNRENGLIPDNFSDAGQVFLYKCNDSLIESVDLSYGSFGISLINCNNVTFLNCNISNNAYAGTYFQQSNNNTILSSNVYNNYLAGIYSIGNDNNFSRNNVLNNIFDGFQVIGDNNTIYKNNISFNSRRGIYISGDYNNITFNNISENGEDGVYISSLSDWNIATMNLISGNNETGLLIYENTQWNFIFNNSFIDNELNAQDNGTNNQWNSIIGNYWDDYIGTDIDDNDIGDSIYLVNGSATARDFFPKYSDGPDPPTLRIFSPKQNKAFSTIAPDFVIEIKDFNLNDTWYKFSNGSQWTEIFFFSDNGTINQTAWDDISDGIINITFYANDTVKNINWTSILVIKDTSAPEINIISPEDQKKIGKDSLDFIVEIFDWTLNTTWYSIEGWAENFTFYDNGTINETALKAVWDSLSHGDIITITFYANDSFGRESSKTVQIKKNDPSDDDDKTPDDTPNGGKIPGYSVNLLLFIISSIAILVIFKKRKCKLRYDSSNSNLDIYYLNKFNFFFK